MLVNIRFIRRADRFSNPRVVSSVMFIFLSVLFEAPHFCLATVPPTWPPVQRRLIIIFSTGQGAMKNILTRLAVDRVKP